MTHSEASPSLLQDGTHPMRTKSPPQCTQHTAIRRSVWPVIAGTFLITLLLFSFQHVVKGAVKQGAERHKSTALLASATRTCKALRDQGASERCSQQLHASNRGTAVQTAFFKNR